jgi:hypothetical protein
MQTVQYFLKRGFGKSKGSYGGTVLQPNSGLRQGSGASPPGFMALSSLIVNAYQRMGHGANIWSSYFSQLFHLCALIYVNDADLLHWPEFLGITPEGLITYVQRATMDCKWLAQPSGGILKERK